MLTIKVSFRLIVSRRNGDYYINLESLISGGIVMTDKTLTCRDCGSEFVFTVGEQEFYKEKGFTNEPTRCAACRRAKKEQNRR